MGILKKIKTLKLDENLISTVLGGSLLGFVVSTNLIDASNLEVVKTAFDGWLFSSQLLWNTLSDVQFGELSITGAVTYLLVRHKSEKPPVSAEQPEVK
jgi:hypothetical protein